MWSMDALHDALDESTSASSLIEMSSAVELLASTNFQCLSKVCVWYFGTVKLPGVLKGSVLLSQTKLVEVDAVEKKFHLIIFFAWTM